MPISFTSLLLVAFIYLISYYNLKRFYIWFYKLFSSLVYSFEITDVGALLRVVIYSTAEDATVILSSLSATLFGDL